MKKLLTLDAPQISYDEPKDGEKFPTYRELLRIGLGRIVPKSAEESMNVHIALIKLKGKEESIDLENEEFKVVKDVIERNDAKMFQASFGPLVTYLKQCEKESEKKPELEVK